MNNNVLAAAGTALAVLQESDMLTEDEDLIDLVHDLATENNRRKVLISIWKCVQVGKAGFALSVIQAKIDMKEQRAHFRSIHAALQVGRSTN